MDRTQNSRSRLLLGTAAAALAVALTATPQSAKSQAFNASETVVSGSASRVFSPGSNTETITVSTPTAVIDWTPQEDNFGNALTFLPDGNTAFFQDAPGQGGFAVLNRILPSTNGNIVVFDGRVVSQLQDASGNLTPGGFVAFYSPTGILVGSTAVFDVGQLLLTTLDVNPGSFDAFYTQGGALTLSSPATNTAAVVIQPGATIDAPSEESFFIVAAPQMTMSGAARINGSTAYVAGTDMTIGYANGLFDIQIRQGTSVGTAILHDGSTGGPASSGAGDNHVIYGVAAAQGNPITMLFGGNLGFDPAVSATIENGDIILAANYDVSGRLVAGGDVSDPASDFFGGNESGFGQADISILAGTYSSRLTAVGTDSVQATATDGDIAFSDDVTLAARQTARILASDGFTLSVGGNARVDASNAGVIINVFEIPSDGDGTGGTASIAAETGGTVAITGDALVRADGFAGYETDTGTGGSGAGGIAEIVGDTGTVDIDGGATVSAIGTGFDIAGLVASGSFTGGDAHIFAVDGGSVDIAGDALVEAGASSTALIGPGAQAGGAVTGGVAQVGTLGVGGSIVIGGSATINAAAFGQAAGSASLTPGLVTGGQALLFASSGGTIDIGLDAALAAWAEGRDNGGGGQGGNAQGGQAVVQSNGLSIDIGGQAGLDSSGNGGDGGSGAGVLGGDGTGGLSSIDASSGTIDVVGEAYLESDADGGDGGIGGNAFAGRSQIAALGTGSISLGSVFMQSIGTGGVVLDANGDGGDGNGGEAELITDGGSIAVTGNAVVIADGYGSDGRNGGAATSGLAGAYAITGSIDVGGDFFAAARAFAGDATLGFGGQGGDAQGGAAFLQADGTATVGASLSVAGTSTLEATGFGGDGGAGDGGAIAAGVGGIGRGGTFNGVQGSGGVFALAGRDTAILDLGDVTMVASGFGGAGGTGGSGQAGGAGGDGFGGTTQAGTFAGRGDGSVDGGSASYGALTLIAGGAGGAGGSGATQGAGGDGQGGFAALLARGTSVDTLAVELYAHGAGGMGADGGQGAGGVVQVGIQEGGSLTAGSLLADATGFGGEATAGDGGNGTGGSASGDYDGNLDVAGNATFIANGLGGASVGGPAGEGLGGTASLLGVAGAGDIGGTLFLNAHGFGGDAQSTDETAGAGIGGSVTAGVSGGATMTLGSAQVSAGGRGGTGPAATGGNGTGGTALITADGAGSDITILGFAPSSGGITPIDAMLSAFGLGGNTTGGTGIGGTGQGGAADIAVSGGASIALADDGPGGNVNTVIARALGGDSSVDGGRGGDAIGGVSETAVDNGTLSLGGFVQSSFAQGGSSANSALSITGGDASGGSRIVFVGNGGMLTGAMPGGGSGAEGGDGSDGGNGGNATGGTNLFVVDGASATLFGPNNLFAGATGGDGAVGGNATGGQVIIQFANGADVTMVGNGDGAGTLGAGATATGGAGVTRGGDAMGDAILISIADSSFSGGIEAVSEAIGGAASGGRGGDATSQGVGLLADNAVLTLNGGSQLSASATGGDGATGGNAQGSGASLALDNGSQLTVASGTGGLSVSDEARAGAGSAGSGTATGGTAAFVLQNASAASADLLRLTADTISSGGTVTGGQALLLAAGNSTGNFGAVVVRAGPLASPVPGSLAQVVSQSGAQLDIGTLDVASDDLFNIAALGGDMAIGDLTASARGGGVSEIQAIGGSIPITGTVRIDLYNTSDLLFTTGQGGAIGGPSVDAPTANIAIYGTADSTISFAADNDAQIGFGGLELLIQSGELEILDGARIGAERLILNPLDTGSMVVVGGDAEEEGYTLTQAEVERIEAGEVLFQPIGSGASEDILIRDLTISGSADEGTRLVEISTGGVVRVEGILAYIDATADDRLEIFADRLEIVTPGGIGIVGADERPTGSFEFYGGDLWMADAETIARLQEDPDFAGRNEVLASVAQGSDDPLGYLRAGDVEFYLFGGGSLLVRNTGTADAPGGITVTGTLEFESGVSSQPLDVFAYGRLLNRDGSFVTGADFFELVNFNRTAGSETQAVTYTDASMFNDCVINTQDCGEEPEPEPETPHAPEKITSSAVLTGPLDQVSPGLGQAEADAQFGVDFPGLIDAGPLTDTSTIDDPVTSGGDSALFGFREQTEGGEADECDEGETTENGETCDED